MCKQRYSPHHPPYIVVAQYSFSRSQKQKHCCLTCPLIPKEVSHPRDKSLECLTSCYIAYHLLFTTFWSVLYFALFGPQASKFAKSDGAGVPGPGQLEAKIFTFLFFARKKNTFFSRKYTPDTQILTFGPILKNRKFLRFWLIFLLFFRFFGLPGLENR